MTFSMGFQSDFRQQLAAVLDRFSIGASTVGEVQDWLLSNLQAILDSQDAIAIRAANELDADLIQLSEQLISAATFLSRAEALVRHLQTITISGYEKTTGTLTASDSETIVRVIERPLATNQDLRVAFAV